MSSIKTIVTLALITTLSIVSIGCSDDVTSPTPIAVDPPVVVVDTAPPAVPSNLTSDFARGQLVLSWDANTTDSDLAGFVLRRDNYGVITTLVGSPTVFQSYQDTPAMGLNVYEIYRVDLVGNESAISSIEFRINGEHVDDDYTQF